MYLYPKCSNARILVPVVNMRVHFLWVTMLWGHGLILKLKNITEEPPLITGETHHSQLGGEQSFNAHSRIQESLCEE